MLVGTSSEYLLKYDLTFGYQGYYKSESLRQVYSVKRLAQLGEDIYAVAGRSRVPIGSDSQAAGAEIICASSNQTLI